MEAAAELFNVLDRQAPLPIQDLRHYAWGAEDIHQVFLPQTVRFYKFIQYIGWLGWFQGVRLVLEILNQQRQQFR